MDRRSKIILTIALWLIAIAFSSLLDPCVARWVRDSGLGSWMRGHGRLVAILDAPGVFYSTAAVAVIVAIAHPLRLRASGFVLLAAVVSGLNGLVKWLVGRTRPFKLEPFDIAAPYTFSPLRGGVHGIFQSKNLCFPSGHAALAFATAAAVAMLWPRSRWRWGVYVIAAITAAERVAENAHWLSDVVAAAALGVGGVHLLHWLLIKLLGEPVPRVLPQQRGLEALTNE
jgi:membrane-associated phospholipid phosphatase